MASEKHYFYVLETKDGTYYGGYTTDPIRRLNEHNQGIGAKYTRLKNRRPVKMIHLEQFASRSLATKQESFFKKISNRAKKKEYLIENKAKSDQLLAKLFDNNAI